MLELLHYLLSIFTDGSDSVKINEQTIENGVTFEIEIPDELKGRVIGKNGMNIKAIRNLVSIIARREEKRVFINILD